MGSGDTWEHKEVRLSAPTFREAREWIQQVGARIDSGVLVGVSVKLRHDARLGRLVHVVTKQWATALPGDDSQPPAEG